MTSRPRSMPKPKARLIRSAGARAMDHPNEINALIDMLARQAVKEYIENHPASAKQNSL